MGTRQQNESPEPTSTRFPPQKFRDGLGYQLKEKYQDGICGWNEYILVSVIKRDDLGPNKWEERWKFSRLTFWKVGWEQVYPNPEELIPIPEELIPKPKKRPTPSTEELGNNTQCPSKRQRTEEVGNDTQPPSPQPTDMPTRSPEVVELDNDTQNPPR